MKAARATIEQKGTNNHHNVQGQRGFGPVWAGRAALTVDCAGVQGQVALKYDAWQREFQVGLRYLVVLCVRFVLVVCVCTRGVHASCC